MEKYLRSGMVGGIGPVYARKLVRAFGEKVCDTREAGPERLRESTQRDPIVGVAIHDDWVDRALCVQQGSRRRRRAQSRS